FASAHACGKRDLGTPDAGNSHVRCDEGRGDRRGPALSYSTGKYSSSSKRVTDKRIRLLQYPATENNTSESRGLAAQAVLPWRICQRKSLTLVTGSSSNRYPNTLEFPDYRKPPKINARTE
ncbi:MAG: hypothetical protein NT142_14015, partial [Planctomycetota bacterium]|nr:hypothetical protein [Planctomycetota bacterium]